MPSHTVQTTDALAPERVDPHHFPLDDIPPLEGKVSTDEWRTRLDLAACYRLIARNGWDDMLSVHVSARVPGEEGKFLINPYGVLFHQVTASSLIKVDYEGNQYTQTPFYLNPAAINIHGGILESRSDVASALHLHTIAGTAVSSLKDGLLPLNQRALYFTNITAYHDYEGIAIEDDERETLARDLGDKWVMFLRNHGTITVGRSVAQAYVYAFFLEQACRYQLATQSAGVEITPLPQEVIDKVPEQATHFKSMGRLEWPALLATLDKEDDSYRR